MRAFSLWFMNLNPPVRWLIYFVVVIMGLSFLFAPTPRKVHWGEISFHTESSAELYFHNMRSYYYHINEREKAPFTLYRFKKGGSGILNFVIVENRLADEAYIFSEWQDSLLPVGQARVYFGGDSIAEAGFAKFTNEDHFRFAARCYQELLKDGDIRLYYGDRMIPGFFEQPEYRKRALSVLEDYFKLVGKK